MRKLYSYSLVILVPVAALGFWSFSRNNVDAEGEEKVPPPAASVTRVLRGPLSNTLRVAGQFIPYQEVDLHAKVSGYIRRISVDIGDRVHAGQTIAVLEVPELLAQVAGAAAQVSHTESEIARAKSEVVRAKSNHKALHLAYTRLADAAAQRPGLVAQQELDDAQAKDENSEAQIAVAEAALQAAEQQLGVSNADRLRVQTLSDYASVQAPFNGVIVKRYADTGSLIQAGTMSSTQAMPVVRVAQSDLLRLRMPVPESDVAFIREGATVQVRVGTLHRTWAGKIIRFSRDLDPSTRTMVAEVDVPNPDLSLNPGMYAETEIVLQHRDSTLSLPSQAVVRDGEHSYVLAVAASHQVQRRKVQIGIEGHNRIEILRGATEGEPVIVSGQANYQAGQIVRPEFVENGTVQAETR